MESPRTTCSAATGPVIAGCRRSTACTLAVLVLAVASSSLLSGCLVLHPPCELDDELFYRTLATSPVAEEVDHASGFLPLSTEPPLVIDEKHLPPKWDMTLAETVRLGLENSKVLRDLGGNVLRRPDLAQTIHDPAIEATDPRFGMEGALAAFDAQFATRLLAYKNDRAFNNLFAGGGTFFFKQDLDNYVSEITKTTATGAAFALRQHIDYDANNAPANFFPSYYNVNIEGEFRQPLLQGGGVQFNRIAGPNATPGLVNGVVIARINNDVSTARFEVGLRDLISNLENGYWDLYYAYRDLDSKISARDASLKTWRIIHANVEQGRGYSKLQEVQALEQYYRFQEEVLDALSGRIVDRTRTFNGSGGGTFRPVPGVQASERRLRLWMGLPINDGKLIRPTDSPPEAHIVFDWHQIMEEALATRPDLRRQQAKVQRYQAELLANRNFLLPQLDIIGRYRWRGYGHDLIGPRDSLAPYNNAFANLTSGQFQEWELGFEYSMPLGFRRGYAAVRNSQVRIARERSILEEQERQAVHDLSAAYADTDRSYTLMQVAYNRLAAAQDQYDRAYNAFFNLGGKVSLELVLDARIRLAEAETSYHRSRIEYAVAIKNVHFEKGSLLEYNGATLAGDAFCRGAPEVIAHKHEFGQDDPPLNYVMAHPPEQPDEATTAAELSPVPAVGPPLHEARVSDADTSPLARRSSDSASPSSVLPAESMLEPRSPASSSLPAAEQSTAPSSPKSLGPATASSTASAGQNQTRFVPQSAAPAAASADTSAQPQPVTPLAAPPATPAPGGAPIELRLAPDSPQPPARAAIRLPRVDAPSLDRVPLEHDQPASPQTGALDAVPISEDADAALAQPAIAIPAKVTPANAVPTSGVQAQ